MVFLAITREGLLDALGSAGTNASIGWCGADALSEEEFEKLKGRNVTRFTFPLQNADADVLADALSTIEEHHHGERIWIERSRQLT